MPALPAFASALVASVACLLGALPAAARSGASRPASEPTRAKAGEGGEAIVDPADADGWAPPRRADPPAAGAERASPEPPTTVRASALFRLALDPWHEGVRPLPGATGLREDVLQLDLQASAHLRHRLRPWLWLALGGTLEYRLTTERPAAEERYLLFNARPHRSDLAFLPGDSYLELSSRRLDLRLGLVTAVWGTTDLVAPNDLLSGRDLRSGPPLEAEAARLPQPMLKLDGYAHGFTLSVAWLPALLPDRLDLYGSDFALLGPAAPPSLRLLGDLARELLDPSIEGAVQPALLQTRLPRPVAESAVGVRLARSLGGVDLALQYGFVWERAPVVRVRPALVAALAPTLTGGTLALDPTTRARLGSLLLASPFPIEASYRRQHRIGLSAARAVGPILLALDLAWSSRQSHPLGGGFPLRIEGEWLTSVAESQDLTSVLAASWARGDEWQLVLEAWHELLIDLARSPEASRPTLLLGGPQRAGLAMLGRWRHPRLGVGADLLLQSDLWSRSLILSAKLSYRLLDRITLFAGLDLFEGAERSLGGRLDPNDQLFLGVQGFL